MQPPSGPAVPRRDPATPEEKRQHYLVANTDGLNDVYARGLGALEQVKRSGCCLTTETNEAMEAVRDALRQVQRLDERRRDQLVRLLEELSRQ